ncbi:hypothetical protein DFH11DRAFT_923923 [Phellopilus nigrolimitatus]|nr:hypothetical protein DFH11DRAFT_923923 [Phellopilus nigrolimitatus]
MRRRVGGLTVGIARVGVGKAEPGGASRCTVLSLLLLLPPGRVSSRMSLAVSSASVPTHCARSAERYAFHCTCGGAWRRSRNGRAEPRGEGGKRKRTRMTFSFSLSTGLRSPHEEHGWVA